MVDVLVVEGVAFRWRLLVGPRDSDLELRLWDESGQQWAVELESRAGDEHQRRRCAHVRPFTARTPDGDQQVSGVVRVRDLTVPDRR